MADTDEQLVVSLEARIRDFEKNFERAAKTASDRWRDIEKSGRDASKRLEDDLRSSTARVNTQLGTIGQGFDGVARRLSGALAGALGVNELRKYADAWTELQNKIKAAGEEESRAGDRLSQITDIALRSRAGLESVGSLYTALRRSSEELGANQNQVLKVTETVAKSLAIGGASAEETSSVILQLGQALGSGTLQGDELRSLLENAPVLAKAIAKEFKGSVSDLKDLGAEGKLTSDKVFSAIIHGAADIEAAFGKTTPTISQAFANLSTAATRYIGTLDQATGTSKAVASGIQAVADHADIALPVVASLGAALAVGFAGGGPIGAGIAGTATALALLGDSIHPIAGELATLGDYGRVAFDLIKQAGADAATALGPSFMSALDMMTAALSGVGEPIANLGEIVKTVLNAIIGAFANAASAIVGSWSNLGAALGEIIVNAMNGVIASVEAAINRIVGAVNSVGASVNGLGAKAGITVGIGTIGDVNLGRITNDYAGAGKAVGEAFGKAFDGTTRDYVGDAFTTIDGAVQRVRERANALGENRAEINRRNEQLRAEQRRRDGDLNAPLHPPKKDDDDKGGGKGKAEKQDAFSKEVQGIEDRITAFGREKDALGKSAEEAAKAEAAFKLLDAAKKAGIPVTDELTAKVDDLATAYGSARKALDDAKAAQQQSVELQRFIGTSLSGFFSDIVSGGKNASEALMNFVKKLSDAALQAALLGQGPLAGLFGMASKENGGVGGLVGGLFKGFGGSPAGEAFSATDYDIGGLFASGGPVQGRGTGTSDSILARVSNGEYVVNARAAATHRSLLDAINRAPGFAAGGIVGNAKGALGKIGEGSPINQHVNVTVNASGGKPAENADLAKKIGAQVQNELRGLMSEEIRNQMRPGNVLNPV